MPPLLDVKIAGPCPCGGDWAAGYIGKEPATTHSFPTCGDFNAREPDRYVEWVRHQLEDHPNSGWAQRWKNRNGE